MDDDLLRRAKANDENAMYELARTYVSRAVAEKNMALFDEAVVWMENAAERNHVEAQFETSVIYGKKGDDDKCIYWTKKAAASGHKKAKLVIQELEKNDKTSTTQTTNKSDAGYIALGSLFIIVVMVAGYIFWGIVGILVPLIGILGGVFYLGNYKLDIVDKIKFGLTGTMVYIGVAIVYVFEEIILPLIRSIYREFRR